MSVGPAVAHQRNSKTQYDAVSAAVDAPTISVVTAIAAVPLGSSLNEMKAALVGVVPTKQAPISASGPNNRFRFIAVTPRVGQLFPDERTASSASLTFGY